MSDWDSSALAKLYLTEPDSLVFHAIADRPTTLRTSPLGQFETILTIRRLELEADACGYGQRKRS